MGDKREKITKSFKFGWSWRLPNNVIVSTSFSTDIEETDIDPEELFKLNYEATKADIKKAIEDNSMIREGYGLLKEGYRKLQKLNDKKNKDN